MDTTTTGMKEFRFGYVTNKNSLSYDGVNVLVTQGPFIKKRFLFQNIINYYVFENQSYRSIFITYYDDKGKQKKVQLFADLGEIGYRDLVAEFNAVIPNKSLNHLPEAEAFKVMKSWNPKKFGGIAAFLIMFTLITVGFYPTLRHFFDFGFAEAVTVEELASGDGPWTKNMNLRGIALVEYSMEETTTTSRSGSSSTNTEVFIPIVSPDWEEGQPITCVLVFDEMSDADYEAVYESVDFMGVVRDVWYEGLESDETEWMENEYGIDISEDAIRFDVTNERHNDLGPFIGYAAIVLIFGIVFIVVAIKQKRQAAGS